MKLLDWLHSTKTPLAQFAPRIGLSISSVSRIAHGLQTPDPDTLIAIRKATKGKVDLDDFASSGQVQGK